MTVSERPLVTLAIFAYNQERFIAEAVSAALRQTYSPLQIVLSDDNSSDQTYQLMQRLAAEYKGPHAIVLNRNAVNLGVGAHVNQLMTLSRGDLIVLGAGDDISKPHRVATLADRWISADRPPALCSAFSVIDVNGQTTGDSREMTAQFYRAARGDSSNQLLQFLRTLKPALIGCTEAWSREAFEKFGPFKTDVWFEDAAMSLRALMLGRIIFVPEDLVAYRQHTTNICNKAWSGDRSVAAFRNREVDGCKHSARVVALYGAFADDIKRARELRLIDDELATRSHNEVRRQIDVRALIGNWWMLTFEARLKNYISVLLIRRHVQWLLWGLPRLLPFKFFLQARSLVSQVRGAIRMASGQISSRRGRGAS